MTLDEEREWEELERQIERLKAENAQLRGTLDRFRKPTVDMQAAGGIAYIQQDLEERARLRKLRDDGKGVPALFSLAPLKCWLAMLKEGGLD